jgi:hypothetical protein
MGDVTLLLQAARKGEPLAVDRLFEPLTINSDPRPIAHRRLRFRDVVAEAVRPYRWRSRRLRIIHRRDAHSPR